MRDRRREAPNRDGGRRKKLIALLRWNHRWSGISKVWLENWRKTGKEPPAEYFKCPELDEALEPLLTAFYELCSERQIGMGMGPIPGSKIRQYAREELDLSGEDRDRFCSIIRQVDNDYLAMTLRADDGPPMREIVSASDPKGMGQLLDRLGKQSASKPPRVKRKPLG